MLHLPPPVMRLTPLTTEDLEGTRAEEAGPAPAIRAGRRPLW